MATFWFETCVEGYFWWKLPVGRQFKSLEEYSPLERMGHSRLAGARIGEERRVRLTSATVIKEKSLDGSMSSFQRRKV